MARERYDTCTGLEAAADLVRVAHVEQRAGEVGADRVGPLALAVRVGSADLLLRLQALLDLAKRARRDGPDLHHTRTYYTTLIIIDPHQLAQYYPYIGH